MSSQPPIFGLILLTLVPGCFEAFLTHDLSAVMGSPSVGVILPMAKMPMIAVALIWQGPVCTRVMRCLYCFDCLISQAGWNDESACLVLAATKHRHSLHFLCQCLKVRRQVPALNIWQM